MAIDVVVEKARKRSLAGFFLIMSVLYGVDLDIELAFGTEAVDVQARHIDIPSDTGLEKSPFTVLSAFELQSSHKAFGGLSGIWLSDDRTWMIAVSDKGQLWQADLDHDKSGELRDLKNWRFSDIASIADDPKGWRSGDAEALAVDEAARTLIIAYEGYHRLRRLPLDNLEAIPSRLPLPKGLGEPSNSGIETLTALGSSRLLAIAERVGAPGGVGLSAWLIESNRIDDLVYLETPGFAPTGADRLNDTLYLVERQFSLLGGFRSGILALSTADIKPHAPVKGRTLATFRFGDLGENFEAIAAKGTADGRTFLYLLSDDNFSWFQRTVLLQLSLPSTGQSRAGMTLP